MNRRAPSTAKEQIIMARSRKRPPATPNTGSEPVPPGATRKAFDRPEEPPGGPPGSGAGPRHAAGDPGTADEALSREDVDRATASTDPDLEEVPGGGMPYGGPSGGAVGGTPANRRITGGKARGGLAPGSGSHRGDSTVGSDPAQAEE